MSTGSDKSGGKSGNDPTGALGSEDEIQADLDAWDDIFDNLHEDDSQSFAAVQAASEAGAVAAPGPDEVIAELLGDGSEDEALEFVGEAQALGGMLGQMPPPLPEAADDGFDEPTPVPEDAPIERQIAPPSRPSAPVLEAAPTDEELFADLPDELPAADMELAEAASATSGAQRIVDPSSALLAESARPPKPAGAAIVRREDLERNRAGAEEQTPVPDGGDFGGGEVTRLASASVLSGMAEASMAALEFERDRVTLEQVVEVDGDFYDDIEIGDDAAESAPAKAEAAPPVAAAAPSAPTKLTFDDVDAGAATASATVQTSKRRINVNVARRRPDGDEPGPVLELEADEPAAPPAARQEAQVVSGTTGDDGDDDGIVASFDLGPAGGQKMQRDREEVDVDLVRSDFLDFDPDGGAVAVPDDAPNPWDTGDHSASASAVVADEGAWPAPPLGAEVQTDDFLRIGPEDLEGPAADIATGKFPPTEDDEPELELPEGGSPFDVPGDAADPHEAATGSFAALQDEDDDELELPDEPVAAIPAALPAPSPDLDLDAVDEDEPEAKAEDDSPVEDDDAPDAPSAPLAAVDAAPQLPESPFPADPPRLDLAALALPEQADLVDNAVLSDAEDRVALLEHELELLDEPAALASANIELGRLWERLGDLERGALYYEAAAEADPRSYLAAAASRRAAEVAGDWDNVFSALDVELQLAAPAERRALAGHRVDLLFACGETELARDAIGETLAEQPGDLRALMAKLELAYCDGDPAAIAAVLDQCATAASGTPFEATLRLIHARRVESDPEAGVRAYRAALSLDAASRGAILGLERIALRANRGADAAAAAKHLLGTGIVTRDPTLASAVARTGAQVAKSAGDDAGYVAGLEAAIGISPDDGALHAELGESLEKRGDREAAVRSYLTAAAHSTSVADQADGYRRAARLLNDGVGSAHDALEAIRRLVALDPDDTDATAVLEAALAEAQDLDSLLALDRRAAETNPDGGVYERVRIAKRLVAAGRADEAAGELQAGRAVAPDSPVLADTLVRTLALAGRTEQRAQLLVELAEAESGHRDPEIAQIRAAQAAEDFAYELMGAGSALAAAGPAAVARAVTAWRGVLDLDPESRAAHSALVRLADLNDDATLMVEALAGAQAAARESARAAGFALRRQQMLMSGPFPNATAAEQLLVETRQLAPQEPRTTLALVMLLGSNQRWEEAASILEDRALALGDTPEAMALRYRAAVILVDEANEPARIVELLSPLATAYPGFGPAARHIEKAHRSLGDASLVSDDLEKKLERARGDGANDQFALLLREAELFEYRMGAPAKAANLYGKALEIRPADPLALDGYVRASAAAGESGRISELALDHMKRATESGDARARADAYEELARVDAELRGDENSALFSYESAAKIDPARMVVLRALERAYIVGDRARDLARVYDWQVEALRHVGDKVHVSLERARVLRQVGEAPEVILTEYKRAYEYDNRCLEALHALEAAARRAGPSTGLAAFEEAAARYFDSDDRARAAFLTRAGETRSALGDVEGAIDCFKAAVQALPGYLPALIKWRRAALRGQLWLDVADAAEQQSEYAHTDRERAQLHHLAAVTCMDRGMPGERAVTALRRVLAIDPSHMDAYLRLRMLFEESAAHEDLVQVLEQRLKVEPDARARLEIHHAIAASLRDYIQQPNEAKKHLRAALAIDPSNRAAFASLASIAWDQAEWGEAAEALIGRAKLERDPAVLVDVFRRLGRIYADYLPDAQWAIKSYIKVLSFESHDEEALDKLSTLSIGTGDWKQALAACERLLQRQDRSPEGKIAVLHRVGEIYGRGLEDRQRAERAYRAAVDVDPTSKLALDELVGFYRLGGDLRSLRVHLDMVASAMRKRLERIALDGTAYAVLTRALAAREEAGARGSLQAAMNAAELAVATGEGTDQHQTLATRVAQEEPSIVGLGSRDVDDVLFHRDVPNGLRQLLLQLSERLAKTTSGDLKAFGVGRSDRVRSDAPIGAAVEAVARQLGISDVEVYVSRRVSAGLAVDGSGDYKVLVGSDLAASPKQAQLRFLAGRALKMAMSGMAVPARMTEADFGPLLVGLLRQFSPEFAPGGIDMGAITEQTSRLRRLVPGGMYDQLQPFALACAGSNFDAGRIWRGIAHTANRAGLLAAGSVQAGLETLRVLDGHADAAAVAADPMGAELMRYSVSEDHVRVRQAIAQAAEAAANQS